MDELAEAEHLLADALERSPTDEEALALYASIKHRRGELTLALGCWRALASRKVHATRDVRRDLALLHARALAQGVESPAAGREGSHDERLLTAFRHHQLHRTDEAVRACRDVAATARHSPELVRLAHYAEAWFHESSGDLDGACAALERLGRDRTFAHDRERLLMLAALYEQTGTKDRLEAALHLYRFLERSDDGQGSYDGHLARVHRALGREDSAMAHEARHLERVRRASQRASVNELLELASRRHIPLDRLARAVETERTLGSTIDDTNLDARGRALLLALAGDPMKAYEALAESDAELDALYRAELARSQGDHDTALPLLVEALEASLLEDRVPSFWAAGALVELLDGPHAERVEAARRRGALDAAIERAFAHRLVLAPQDPQAIAWLARWSAAREDQDASMPPARSRQRTAPSHAAPTGRILSAAVHRTGAIRRGLFHELWADRERVESGKGGNLPAENVLGNVTDDFARDVRNVFYAVREWAKWRLPHHLRGLDDHRYVLKVTKDDETSGGRSAGLAVALAVLSALLERPIPGDLAASGAIVADSYRHLAVARVGDVEPKSLAAFEAHLGMLLLPLGNRLDLERSHEVPRLVVENHVRFVSTFEEAARFVFGHELFD